MTAKFLRDGLKAAIVIAALLAATGARAKTTGVGDDPALQTGPCYEALVDKNAANPTTAPNRELGAACEAEHGDVEKAWARVIRLWGSDSTDIPDYDSYRRPDEPVGGAAPLWLAITGLLLTYAVLGAPMRSAARLFGVLPGPATGAVVDLIASLALRGLIAAAFIAITGLPYAGVVCALALIGWIAYRFSRLAPTPREPAPASPGAHVAEVINDAVGAAPGLLALALFVQHSWLAFGIGLALPLAASLGPAIHARRKLRATRLNAALAAAALAAALGATLVGASPLSGWLPAVAGANFILPILLAGLTLAAGFALAKPARL